MWTEFVINIGRYSFSFAQHQLLCNVVILLLFCVFVASIFFYICQVQYSFTSVRTLKQQSVFCNNFSIDLVSIHTARIQCATWCSKTFVPLQLNWNGQHKISPTGHSAVCTMFKVGIKKQAGKRGNDIQELVSETSDFPLSYILRFVVIQWLVVGASTTWLCLQKRDVLLYNWFWLVVWKWARAMQVKTLKRCYFQRLLRKVTNVIPKKAFPTKCDCEWILLVWEHNFRRQKPYCVMPDALPDTTPKGFVSPRGALAL